MAAHDLEHLRTFLTVLRAGSVSEGARLLGMSQASASAHVQALERQLGATLFERTPAGVVATPRAVALGRTIASHLDALDDALAPPTTGDTVTIELGGAAEFLGEVVAPGIDRLTYDPAVRVRMRFGLAEPLLDELRAGGLDIVVSSLRPTRRGLSAAPLVDEEFVLVAAPGFRPAERALDESALTAIPLLAYGDELPIVRRYWRTVFGRRPDALEVRAVLPDLRAIRAALVGGAGMSVLPGYLVSRELATGELVVLHEPEVAPLNTLYVVTRTGELERREALRRVVAALHGIVAR
ncbi:LysR family transcriptional regulator [Agromyces sp. NPDC058126]|uniref:LysR family transcriptional regulator n=1 Tax=Agromyces sp. NPDC058126 TaxID=3346350 RepID=UPI0036D8639C